LYSLSLSLKYLKSSATFRGKLHGCASLPIIYLPSIPLSSTFSHNHPYNHHLQISFSPFSHPCYLLFWALEIRHKLHLPIYVSGIFLTLSATISDVSISICSWPRNNQYLEVLRFDVFQLRSTNFRRLHHNTLHSIGFSAVSSSIHHQPLSCLVPTRRSVHSTR
jgi:hypothetical protein